jgi:uncharacterized membrane protein YecN with MAPEG domain
MAVRGVNLAPVTGAFALPFSLYYILLSGRVVYNRKLLWLPMGDRAPDTAPADLASDPLYNSIRCQTNFLENAPLGLILAGLAELNGASRRTLTRVLGAFLFTRVVHVELGLRWPGTRGWGRHIGYWGSLIYLAGTAVWGANLAAQGLLW